jgi:hypothetical protein
MFISGQPARNWTKDWLSHYAVWTSVRSSFNAKCAHLLDQGQRDERTVFSTTSQTSFEMINMEATDPTCRHQFCVCCKTLLTVVLFSHGLPLMQVHQPCYMRHVLYLVCTDHEHLAIWLLGDGLSAQRVFQLLCKCLLWHLFSFRHQNPNRFSFQRPQMIKKCRTWEPPVHVYCVPLVLY